LDFSQRHEIKEGFLEIDAVLVIGADDIVNPGALENPNSPIAHADAGGVEGEQLRGVQAHHGKRLCRDQPRSGPLAAWITRTIE
jgi:hypothetical protein